MKTFNEFLTEAKNKTLPFRVGDRVAVSSCRNEYDNSRCWAVVTIREIKGNRANVISDNSDTFDVGVRDHFIMLDRNLPKSASTKGWHKREDALELAKKK